MPSRRWLVVGLALMVTGLPAAPGRAQAGSSGVSGFVFDQTGATLPGAAVTIAAESSGQVRTVRTNEEGFFGVSGLLPDVFRLSVTQEGFRPAVFDGIRLATGETLRVDVRLEVAVADEAVTVRPPAADSRSESPGLGQIVDERRVVELPLDGRSFVQLTALATGVALPPDSDLPRINGGRPRTNEYLFDGISVLQPEPGQVAFHPVVDAIQEFKVETNSPPAEFGRFNGGVINLTTRSGTNTFRGSLFEFLRHEALNARNLFASGPATAKPLFRRQQAGGVAGGPIVGGRTFFFADAELTRERVGRVRVSTVPTELQRRGIFTEPVNGAVPALYDPATTATSGGGLTRVPFDGNHVPSDRLDPVAMTLLDRYPMPTDPGTSNNYRRVGTETVDRRQLDVRIDHRVTDSDRSFVRISHAFDEVAPVGPLPDGSGVVTSGAIGDMETTVWSVASSLRSVLGGTLHELRVGYTRRAVSRSGVALGETPSVSLGLPGLPAGGPFPTAHPTIRIDGLQELGSPPNTYSDFRTDVTELVDTLTWTRGLHTFKAGVDARWSRLDIVQPASPAGIFHFTAPFTGLPGVPGTGSALASFLLGAVDTFSIDLQQRAIRPRAHVQEYFFQDDWRPTAGLTVNAGLRYTLNFPSTEVDDQGAVFNLETRQIEYLGRDGHPRSARRLHTLNFGPRLGVSARVTDRTLLRTGYAMVWIEQSGITTPFTAPQFPFLQTVTDRTLDGVEPAFRLASGPTVEAIPLTSDAGRGQGVFAVDSDLGSGYAQQWHLAARRTWSAALWLELAYVGSKITRVGIPDVNLNQLSTEQLARGPELLQPVPNPFFGEIAPSSSLGDRTVPLAQLLKPYPDYTTVSYYRHNVGNSIYHGVEAKLEQRFRDGLSFLVGYTRSKLLDDASAVFNASILAGPVTNTPAADAHNRRLERDVSNGDIPHVLVGSVLWDVPLGRGRRWMPGGAFGLLNDWTVTAIATLQSGVPIAVTQATNYNAFAGFGTQRPNRIGDPRLPGDERTVARWFDTAAFDEAPPFTLGTSSRNPVRGPAYRNVDLAVFRRVSLPARGSIELRVEVFNLTNTPPLGPPNGVLGTPAFGSITAAGDPRVVQLGVKWLF